MTDVSAYRIVMSEEVQKHMESLPSATREYIEVQLRNTADEAGRHHDANVARWRTPTSGIVSDGGSIRMGAQRYPYDNWYDRREVSLGMPYTAEGYLAT
ncbi:hypothetical protein [Comamonas sp. JC664]|uniref:hypothetical protein n=1 Tax=Comamonas sp. JC664 TaxID=2801917 RepID=UPI00174D11E0|nr:hypothetical protein [Comamonas sp. JC664]MBL0698962.1 hypothetical protein [Comamonas sp. JC664]GHG79798.1 hypothetical protein GCM10012319_32020 [Comamonas sp. KCTC 72670]